MSPLKIEKPIPDYLMEVQDGFRHGHPKHPIRSSELLPGFLVEEYALAQGELPLQSKPLAHTLMAVIDSDHGNTMAYSERGRRRFRNVHADDVFVRSFEPVSQFGWTRSLRMHSVCISREKLREVADKFAEGPAVQFQSVNAEPNPGLAACIHALSIELFRGAPRGEIYCESFAICCALRALSAYGMPGTRRRSYKSGFPTPTVSYLLDYIHANLDQPLLIASLAEATGYPLFAFQRLFKRSFGYPCHQFITATRLKTAALLMRTQEDLNLSAVAAATGFSHESHLRSRLRKCG